MSPRQVVFLSLSLFLSACVSSTPTAEQLDNLEQKVRAEYRQDYVILEEKRQSGSLAADEYDLAKQQLDKRVRNRVDTMAWSRHALVQSDLKANDIPTPDKPQSNMPPGVGSIQGSVYNSTRQNGIGNQAMGNMMQEQSGAAFNARRAGTLYDQ